MAFLRSFVATVACAHAHSSLSFRKHIDSTSFVKPLEFNHQLRVCNAYPNSEPLDVYLDGTKKLTQEESMVYKSCRDFPAQLKSGDQIDFKVGDSTAGTFSVADLPNNDATILLVIHRHDTLSTAVAFESHVFASLANAQVAIIDAYKGHEISTPKIKDAVNSTIARSEELRYNSVVAINQGKYRVSLDDHNGTEMSVAQLVALDHESYVVMRTGVEANHGDSFPQDLVVFPQSDPKILAHSGAGSMFVHMTCAIAIVLHVIGH